jgi:hypothetical protein
VEVEVHAESSDVRGNKQTTNIGYFCVGGSDESNVKLKFAQVIPSTVEQTERFSASLGRLLIAAVRLEGFQNDQTLDATLSAAACSASHLLRAHDDSIWNSSSAVAVLSPLFQLDCARSLAHNDVCGLVCASADARSGEGAFETLHSAEGANGVLIKRRISGAGSLTLACVIDIQVARLSLPCFLPTEQLFYSGSTSLAEGSYHGHEEKGGLGKNPACAALRVEHVTTCILANKSQDPIMKGEVIHDIYKDEDTQLDLVWMGSAIAKGQAAFGMDLALLRCCRRIDDQRFAIVSRRSITLNLAMTICFFNLVLSAS